MDRMRRGAFAGGVVGALLAAGAIGATAFGASSGGTQSPASTAAVSTTGGSTGGAAPGGAAPGGVFKPIETPSHEAGESAQREAQESAGQFPTVP